MKKWILFLCIGLVSATLATAQVNLKDFDSFGYIKRGMTWQQAVAKLGEPQEHDSSGTILGHISYDYNGNTVFTLRYDISNDKVEFIHVYGAAFAPMEDFKAFCKAKKLKSKNFKFIGMTKAQIIKKLGKPTNDDSSSGPVYDDDAISTNLEFYIYSFNNDVCKEFRVFWKK